MSIPEYIYDLSAAPAVTGSLGTGQDATIEVWRVPSGDLLSVTSDVCLEIDDTGIFSWSIGNIPTIPSSRTQYHFRMSGSVSGTAEGDFVIQSHESLDGGMPSLNNQSSYILIV